MSCLLQCCIDRILKGKSSMFGLKARGEQLGFWQVTFPLSFSTLLLYLAWILISQDCQAVMHQGLTLTLVPRKPWLDSKGKHIYYASSAYRQFLVTTTKQSYCTVWMFGGDTFPQLAFWEGVHFMQWLYCSCYFCHSSFSRKWMRCHVVASKIFGSQKYIHHFSKFAWVTSMHIACFQVEFNMLYFTTCCALTYGVSSI